MRKFEFKVPDLFSDKLWEILESLWAAVCLQGRTGWQNYQKYIDSIIELQNTGFKSEKTRNRDETKIVVFKLIFWTFVYSIFLFVCKFYRTNYLTWFEIAA